MPNKLLVIIVSYNSMRWIKQCYDSLRHSTVPCDVVTVDNGSTDGTQAYIQEHYPEVVLLQQTKNLGFGQANNLGLRRMLDNNYEYAYLLNQDAWVMPDTFEQLINVSLEHPEYGILSPMQLEANGQHWDEKFRSNTLGEHQRQSPFFIEDQYFGRTAPLYNVSFVMAAHWFLTRRCVQLVGGFSPSFFVYGEDDNYIHRVFYNNLSVGIVPKAQAIHDRENAVWSREKKNFIEYYTMAIGKCSDPTLKHRIRTFIIRNIKESLRQRNAQIARFALRLFKERKQIEINYRQSLQPTAFL